MGFRYVSIFSGVEAATLAWDPLGWEPVAFSEIDPFLCAVLAERWPDVPNLGDITKIDWKEEIDGAIDLVVGDPRVNRSRWRVSAKASKAHLALCSSTFDAYRNFVLAGFYGKTSQERSRAKMGGLSDSCLGNG